MNQSHGSIISLLHSLLHGKLQKGLISTFYERGNIQDEPNGEERWSAGFNCGVDAFGILSFRLVIACAEAAIGIILPDAVASTASFGTGLGTPLSMSWAKSSAFTRRAPDVARSARCVIRNVVTLVLAMWITTLAASMSIAVLPDGR
jgi:hypothetical protein